MGVWLISSSLLNQIHRPPLLATKKFSEVSKTQQKKARSVHSCYIVLCSRETDSEQFEVDPDKARQALRDLDRQIQSFSTKRVPIPNKNQVEEMKFPRNEMREEMTEISGTLLANSAFLLFLFSIFYNVLFYTVIKPSIDIPLPTSMTSLKDSTDPSLLQQLPLSSLFISPSRLG